MAEVIGVVHLKPLPGSPNYTSLEEVVEDAIRDAKILEEGGVDAIIIENYGDKPFKKEVGKEVVACMTAIALEVKREISLPIGINVLRNDAIAALSIAKAVKADFIRVNQLFFPSITPEGIIDSKADEIMRFKRFIDCNAMIFADISVKHAIHLASIEDYILNAERSLADALILTGKTTGAEVNLNELKYVRKIVDMPLIVGSGVTAENVSKIVEFCDGVIVGTYFKRRGRIDIERVRKLVNEAKR